MISVINFIVWLIAGLLFIMTAYEMGVLFGSIQARKERDAKTFESYKYRVLVEDIKDAMDAMTTIVNQTKLSITALEHYGALHKKTA